jgi:hypothetical protein
MCTRFFGDTIASYRINGDRPRNGLAADTDKAAGVLAKLDVAGDE